ncbi:hypothetical protein DASC09_027580 [Saccharomycopsis crataegensis]|uniref:Inositol polyphosphate-related phosphatase domain-containing protein n=1 Tax=Saccharomycopsis crataegensis TaxID=43959 RepID=A0AAV5QKN9_9ASCO|nr:hypothetical protein DASC09_027580 [Saccharomycopsis crataegensis]
MELVTDKTKLWYFPPDSEEDVPRYALQTAKGSNGEFLIYDEIKLLTNEDILKIQPLRVNSDQMQVNFRNSSIGSANFDDDEAEDHFTNFVSQWKSGLKFIEQSKSETTLAQLKQQRQLEEKKRQKIQLFKFLCSNLKNYIKPSDINVRIITWNLQGNSRVFETERENLKKLLNVQGDLNDPNIKAPDMYIINLQETVILNTLSFYSSPVLVNEWANFIIGILNEEFTDGRPSSSSSNLTASDRILNEEKDSLKYDYLVDNRLVGLSSIIIVRQCLKRQISNIEVSTTGTGILNMFGNKGAILIKFTFSYDKDILPYITDEATELTDQERKDIVHGYKFVVVNTHLTAGENNLAKRKRELQAIEKNLRLKEYFKDDSFYLVNPLLSYDYFNSNSTNGGDIDPFKFNDQETMRDNRLISMEDLTLKNKGNDETSKKNSLANGEQFQDISLMAEQGSTITSPKETASKIVSPLLGLADKFPKSPSLSLNDGATFKVTSPNISDSKTSFFNDCFVFFGGDMNFRLVPLGNDLQPTDATANNINEANKEFQNEVKELVLQKRIDALLERDSLSIEKGNLNILGGFNEAPIDFMPTYKCMVKQNKPTVPSSSETITSGSINEVSEDSNIDIEDLSINSGPYDDTPYDFARIPSYTDRIFFSESNIFEDDPSESPHDSSSRHIRVNKYESVPDFTSSDHRPVYLDLTLQKLDLIDFDERYKLMKSFLKTVDLQENSKKPVAEISPIDMKVQDLKIFNKPMEHEVVIENNGKKRFSWEIVNYDPKNLNKFVQVESTLDTNDVDDKGLFENYLKQPVVEVFPTQGTIPALGKMKVKIKVNSVKVGIKKILLSLILRIIGAKDFFLTYEFITKNSIFGESLDLLNNIKGFGSSSGIPPSIYELVNYLSNNLHQDMFNDVYDFNGSSKMELESKILDDLDLSIREQLENSEGLDQNYIKQTTKFNGEDETNSIANAMVRTLLLLLNNLDGGIIPKEFATFILDDIQLPSFFNLNINKFELQSDITTKVLEFLPGLRANVFMYISSFLTLYLNQFQNADRNYLASLFEEALISLPADASRAIKGKRREVLKILI